MVVNNSMMSLRLTKNTSQIGTNFGVNLLIRKLLSEAFSEQDFNIFCYDHFHTVYNKFASGMSFQQKIQFLIEYCDQNELFDTLLLLVKEWNPRKYDKFITAADDAGLLHQLPATHPDRGFRESPKKSSILIAFSTFTIVIIGVIIVIFITSLLTGIPLPFINNRPPIIEKITVSQSSVFVGEEARVSVVASDPDEDNLVFYWEAKAGKVPAGAQGDNVIYIAPKVGGLDTITVSVTDGTTVITNGVQISVINSPPTPIPMLINTPPPPTYTPIPTATRIPLDQIGPSQVAVCSEPNFEGDCRLLDTSVASFNNAQYGELSNQVASVCLDKETKIKVRLYQDENWHENSNRFELTVEGCEFNLKGRDENTYDWDSLEIILLE